MSDKFDRYREALVVETDTLWPADIKVETSQRAEIQQRLHADAAACTHLEYIRVPTGFCRKITVAQEDLERVT